MARFSTEELLEAVRQLEAEEGAYPSASRWESWPLRPCNHKTLVNRFGSWTAALKAAGIKTRRKDGPARRFTPEQLLSDLIVWSKRTGIEPPTIGAWDASAHDDGRANSKTYRTTFGTWTAALEAAGFVPLKGYEGGPRFSVAECANALRSFWNERGESPTQNGWPAYAGPRGLMSEKAIARRLGEGSWNRALEAAGLPTRAPGSHSTAGREQRKRVGRNRQMVTAGKRGSGPVPWDPGAAVESIRGGAR